MKSLRVAVAAAFLAASTYAEKENDSTSELAALSEKIEQMLKDAPTGPHGGKLISPEIKELMDRRSGGLVIPKTNGNTVMIVDARGEADGFLDAYVAGVKTQFHIGITPVVKEIAADEDLFAAAMAAKTVKSPAVVMIVSREKTPVLSIFPEDAVGVVNAAPLKTGDAKLYHERLTKEVSRCMALAFGGFATAAPNGKIVKSILSPLYSVKDLDNMKLTGIGPGQCNAIYESMALLGVQAARPVVYSVACRQGWAPAPTNAIQKAIWDKVHAVPATPMKIEFDPKKGR